MLNFLDEPRGVRTIHVCENLPRTDIHTCSLQSCKRAYITTDDSSKPHGRVDHIGVMIFVYGFEFVVVIV